MSIKKILKFVKIYQSHLTLRQKTIVIIALIVWSIWLNTLGIQEAIAYCYNHWEIALTMMFGSIIAGGTSIGGGAVAFPVFTKLLNVSPHDAKVFSLAIQSVGMSAASVAIWVTRIRVEWRTIIWASIGGAFGIWIGLAFFYRFFPPDMIKMSFTMMIASLPFSLIMSGNKRQYYLQVNYWSFRERVIFFLTGLLGGIMSSLFGNGIDILTFSVMVLLFRISEKVATPTSVVLMAINAVIGFTLQVFFIKNFTDPALSYWLAAVPVVVIGAPLGAMFCSLLRRQTIVNILIGIILIELLTSLLIIPLRVTTIYVSLIIFILFSLLNYWMYYTDIYAIKSIKKGTVK
ncbi:sulfite exporter TauE/SafE family protein [Moorena producens JHB]|uniref:Probable membrane transporter protein n=1 Tax=Moorena producens (strain JHB) TaxID=1454205 RepID=A0A1D9G5M5_MOOP1|nr:sulfite exporter TauE/SafE family protein [Moorena producens]AOY82906.1 sulfite exporter TauE/SafE family protein [Moorena producens JHB]